MTARLVTAPVLRPVTLTEVKQMVRVTDDAEEPVLEALILAAIGMLDGRGGLLSRAIMPQVWAEDLTGNGPWVLALPDIDAETLTVTVDGVAVVAPDWTITLQDSGALLTLANEGGSAVTLQYGCGMPEARLKVVKVLIGLMVDAWYYRRSEMADPMGLPPACLAMVEILRWQGV